MNKEELIVKISEFKLENNKINYFNIIEILKLLWVNISDFGSRLEKLKKNLQLNNHILNTDILEKDEKIYLSNYATYFFIDKIDKKFFSDISIYKYSKSYFYAKDFDWWANDKKIVDNILEEGKNIKYLNPKEIWDCKLWVNIWWEADWKWKHMRPVLILQRVWLSFLVLPLTKHWKREKERSWKFYYELKWYFDIDSFVMLSQLKTIDKKRCIKHIETINNDDYNNIIEKVKKLYFPVSNQDIQ